MIMISDMLSYRACATGNCRIKMSDQLDFDVSDLERISERDIEACEREFKCAGVEGCRRFLEGKQEEWKNIPLNVAVIGNSGVGKSSFINAIRYAFGRFSLR